MGSARMGVSRDVSAVDPNGECWDVQDLFVADAALMPTSTGARQSLRIVINLTVLAETSMTSSLVECYRPPEGHHQ